MQERRATVNGIEMRWLEAGAGTPVVFLHGIPTSPELWRHVVPRVPAVENGLADLDVPAALAWGAADRFQKIEYGERFAHDLGAPLDRIEGGKHFTPEDHPEEVARAVRRVLARVDETASAAADD